MKPDAPEAGEAGWRNLSWTLVIVLLITILIVAAIPWLAHKATTPIGSALSGR